MELNRLYAETINTLKGKFTKGELSMMLDVSNGTYLTAGTLAWSLKANIEDSFLLYPNTFEDKWTVDKEAFLKRLSGLDGFEVGCLQIWAADFWKTGAYQAENAIPTYLKYGAPVVPDVKDAIASLKKAVDLMEQSKDTFKSKRIAGARAEVETALKIIERL